MSASELQLHELLNNIATEQNYQNYDLKVFPISTGGGNYSSILYGATISSANRADLHLFIKVAAASQQMRDMVSAVVYETEQVVYTEIQATFKEIEKKHQVPEKHWLRLPKCYGAIVTPLKEMLVLENLTAQGFEMFDRFKSMDWEYASAAVTELAKFHSLSMAFIKEYPEQFTRIRDKYFVDWFSEGVFNTFWGKGVSSALDVLTEENSRLFKKFSDGLDYASFKKNYRPGKVEVIIHGDYRPSNLMHKILQNGKTEIVVTDYQTVLVGSPVIDLLYLIFTGTDKEFRDQHYDQLVALYYTRLTDAMTRLDIDPERTYSKEAFYSEMKEKLPYGLMNATYTLPYITVEAEKAPAVSSTMDLDSFSIAETGAQYADRMNGVVTDCITWGVLTE